jgi:hypothetical protein
MRYLVDSRWNGGMEAGYGGYAGYAHPGSVTIAVPIVLTTFMALGSGAEGLITLGRQAIGDGSHHHRYWHHGYYGIHHRRY